MNSFGKAIRSAREQREWTQANLAQRLSVTQSTISFWENGVQAPSLENKVRLIELMPEILNVLAEHELNLLDHIQTLERTVLGGKCACADCTCSPEATIVPISSVAHEQHIVT